MTTGTKTAGVPNVVGYYYKKTWSGADAPSAPRSKPAYGPPTAYYYYKMVKGQPVRKLGYHKGRILRPAKRARQLSPHSYTMSLTEANQQVTELYRAFPNPNVPFAGYRTPTSVGFNSTITNNDIISAVGNFRRKLNGGSDFDASVFLGTAHQSLNTITESAVKIARAIHDVRKGNIADAARTLTGKARGPKHRSVKTDKAMSQNWLELQYGWMPLLQDVHESGSFVADLLADPMRFRIKNSIRRDNLPVNGVPGSTYLLWQTQNCFEVYSITGYFTEKPSALFKLGLNNPANLAWELLPWSFVLDWFVPVGDYLNARGVAGYLNGTFVTTQYSRAYASGTKLSPINPPPGANIKATRISGGGGSCLTISLTRTISSSLSVPPPTFKPLEKVLSWKRAANAIALLVGMDRKI